MKIHYKKKINKQNLIFGIVWLLIAVIQVSINEQPKWFHYMWFVLAILYFVLYYQQTKPKYLLIENETLKENWLLGKAIKLGEINSIKHFAGEYILKAENMEFRISIDRIENDSLLKLDEKLKSLNVDWS
ncbi:hypothetical protein [Winogradskyella sp.]|uniref:hypothetical protein n=1 Tax=Winogradskyella sp. TaxID=1883156 RepID=UPI002610F864|nr:hypothetical protein [Winogradskyella sp.]